MPKRQRIKGSYVTRRKDGTFKNWVKVGKSINIDKKRESMTKCKQGYGNQGDRKPTKIDPRIYPRKFIKKGKKYL
ncbi:MAG: hypothetical protein ACOCUD_01660 [Bacillota bacterium]